MINSPTHTDSTDEPTPLSLFNNGKAFKFANGLLDEQEIGEGSIGFEERTGGEKRKDNTTKKAADKKDKSKIFGSQKSLFKSLFSNIGLKKGRPQMGALKAAQQQQQTATKSD